MPHLGLPLAQSSAHGAEDTPFLVIFMHDRESRPSTSAKSRTLAWHTRRDDRKLGRRHGGTDDGDRLRGRPVLGVAGVAVEEAADLRVLADEGHLGGLGLAAEAAEAVLDDGVAVALEAVAVGDDGVDLELELGAEVLGQRDRVDEVGLAADEQHARRRLGVVLLGRLDAVPHDAHREAVHVEAPLLARLVEGLGRRELEEDDLGRAAVVLAVGLGRVDVGGVDASGGAHGVDGGDETVGGEVRGQVDQEKRAVEMVGDVGGLVSQQVGVAMVVRTESQRHLGRRIIFVSTGWLFVGNERSTASVVAYQHGLGILVLRVAEVYGGRFRRDAHSFKRSSMHAVDAVHGPIVLVGCDYLRSGLNSTT